MLLCVLDHILDYTQCTKQVTRYLERAGTLSRQYSVLRGAPATKWLVSSLHEARKLHGGRTTSLPSPSGSHTYRDLCVSGQQLEI